MARIRRLPDSLINQIAAGEAVERPASVAKELLENALDAGATRIEIAVEGGGRRSIRVADDGCGMDAEDARLALERHATSKIASAADLEGIRTLGFRGEALSAIASVSRLRLRTAREDGRGFLLEAEGGAIRRATPDAHPRGTTVEVRDLFYNTPARAKFLRTEATELSRITEAVQAMAIARPDVRLRLTHGPREILSTAPTGALDERVRQIFGVELAGALMPFLWGSPPLTASGMISRPAASRAGRSLQFVFVNRRPVTDRTLSHAVSEACRPYFPRDRFPALFLFLEVPPAEVDVNVHPTKREVRFRTPGAIHDLTRRALEKALASTPPVQETGGPRSVAVSDAIGSYLARAATEPDRLPFRPPTGAGVPERELPGTAPDRRVVGQLRDTYILVEETDGLLVVDQHAAHERLLYDRFRAAMETGDVPVQSLLFPVTVEVTPAVAERLEPLLERLAAMGFGVEPFGPRTFLVREVPALMTGADPARLLQDLAEAEGSPACHAAVRAGMRLEGARMRQIVEDLLTGAHPQTCPHGRPTSLRYPLREIHRAFLRP